MCGIAGFIGNSKEPDLSYSLISSLFVQAESRGIDASGFWAVTSNHQIIYHKEPTKSSDFVGQSVWQEVDHDCSIMLVHARGASVGVGSSLFNANNHPFVSTDQKIALVHNGRIPDEEYHPLYGSYDLESTCDSEVLLKLFESGEGSSNILKKLSGIQNIWRHVVDGHMAVAIGEFGKTKKLWLFRNEHRTMWSVDLREQLGQIFFFSSDDMWTNSVFGSNLLYKHFRKANIHLLATEEIKLMELKKSGKIAKKTFKVQKGVKKQKQYDEEKVQSLIISNLIKEKIDQDCSMIQYYLSKIKAWDQIEKLEKASSSLDVVLTELQSII